MNVAKQQIRSSADPLLGALIVAGGLGRRCGGDRPKQFLCLQGRPIITWSVAVFRCLPAVAAIVLVVPAGWEQEAKNILEQAHQAEQTHQTGRVHQAEQVLIVSGGQRRQDSVAAGLAALPPHIDWVAVHDAARPGLPPATLQQAWQAALKHGNAVCALPSFDTLVEAEDGVIKQSLDRSRVFRIQTPQIFPRHILTQALQQAESFGWQATDDAGLVRNTGTTVHLCPGSENSLKITRREDLALLSAILAGDSHPGD